MDRAVDLAPQQETDRATDPAARASATGSVPASAAQILKLQQTVGNRGTGGVLALAPAPVVAAATFKRASGIKPFELDRILKDANLKWTTVKASWLADTQVMTELVAYRKWVVDGLIDELRKEERFTGLKTRSAGSEALSSDYDITFMGDKGAEAVQEFNRRFGARWGKESGVVFDTNVYAEDVLPTKEKVKSGKDDATLLGSPGASRDVDARLDEGLQDVSSLVKARKNMTRKGWQEFTDGVVGRLTDRSEVAEAKARFAQANTIFERTYVQGIVAELESTSAGREKLEKVSRDLGGKPSQIAVVEALLKDDQGVAVSNRVYEKKLLYAAELQQRRKAFEDEQRVQGADPEKLPQWKTLTVDLRKAKADAMLFANEPYFSAGTLYHVVGNLQAGYGATLSPTAMFQSLQENYGDALKEFHHLAGKDFATVAIQTSKYIWRMLDAAMALREKGITFTGSVDLVKLRDAEKVALDVRQKAPGAKTREEAVAELHAAGIVDQATLENAARSIALNANIAFRAKSPALGATAS